MKNKILISLVACFIAAGSIIHFNLAQTNSMNDICLADISVMAQADGESGGDVITCRCNTWGNCKVTGSKQICAQSEPGGNIDCRAYDSNC